MKLFFVLCVLCASVVICFALDLRQRRRKSTTQDSE